MEEKEDEQFFDDAFGEGVEPQEAKAAEETPSEDSKPAETEVKAEEADKPPAEPEETEAKEAPEKEEEPEPTQETQSEPESNKIDPEQFKGYLDERDKRQKAEADAKAYKEQLEAIRKNQEQAQQQVQVPDMFDDPDGYNKHFQTQMQQIQINTKLDTSEMLARQEYGADKVQEAQVAFQNLSYPEKIQIQNSPHPYKTMIDRMEETSTLQAIREAGGLDKYVEAQIAAKSAVVDGKIAEATQEAPKDPPPSLAKGGQNQQQPLMVTEEEAFDNTFAR